MAHEVKHSKTSMLATDDGNEGNSQQPQIYAKNSIDRFGDDLCALLLSYFPLEDHIRCESLSKQFQRTVFRSVVHICIDEKFMRRLPKSNISQILATIAIKCGNIQTIDCRGIVSTYEEHQVLTTFRDYCRHLKEVYCNLWENSLQTMRSFGPLVTRIGGIDYCADREAITHCHRLSHLRIDLFRKAFGQSGTLLAMNLHSFDLLEYLDESDEHQLSAFVAHNQCLRSAAFSADDICFQLYRQLSRLTQLRELRLTLWLTSGENSLYESLRTIGLNCKHLQRLTLKFNTDFAEDLNDEIITEFNSHSLDSMRFYRRLKRLDLCLNVALNPEVLEPLTLCQRLTHLTLNSWEMSDKLYVNCDKHWPRLQYLSIRTKAITHECLDHISRLPALQMFCLHCHHSNGLTDNDFEDLLSRSPKLKAIEFIVKNIRKIFIV